MVRQRRLNNVRKTPYRLRSQAKYVKIVLQQHQYRQAVAIIMTVHIGYLRRQVIRRLLLWLLILLLLKYYHIKTVVYRDRHWFGNNMMPFHSLDVNDCWHKLRFKKQHL